MTKAMGMPDAEQAGQQGQGPAQRLATAIAGEILVPEQRSLPNRAKPTTRAEIPARA
jgi:hypothetical protein